MLRLIGAVQPQAMSTESKHPCFNASEQIGHSRHRPSYLLGIRYPVRYLVKHMGN